MRRETVDILEDLVLAIPTIIEFTTNVDNGDGTYTITTCNTSYLFPCFKFSISGVTYKVLNEVGKEFKFNQEFTIKGNVQPMVTSVTLDPLKYFHGTVIATKAELDREELASDKFPMVYLLEVLHDDFNGAANARIERVSALRLFFLSHTDGFEWNTNEDYEYSIKPMRNMVYSFIDLLEDSDKIGNEFDWTATNHAKFGIYVDGKGHTRRIFDDKLSGVELRINLPIVKDTTCSLC